jgi:hypothetical protein
VKKKYSDPLMFSSALLTTIPIKPSDNGTIGPDDPWDEDDAAAAAGLRLNASPSQQTSDPVTIVNPIEEAVNSTDSVTEEASGTATTTTPSPLEVEPVIDDIVPEEAPASAPTTGE